MRSLLLALPFLLAPTQSSFVNGPTHKGEELTCDLPGELHLRNGASRVDGRGLCVMTSLEMAAAWQGLESLRGLRDWSVNEPGGSYPAKVDRQLTDFCAARGIAVPAYVQYEGNDPKPILDWCERTGRLACVTYGWSPRYGGTISHMTCCPKFGDRWAVCLDCNYPGDQSYEWMSRAEMIRRIGHPTGAGWVFVWLAPPPPPVPFN